MKTEILKCAETGKIVREHGIGHAMMDMTEEEEKKALALFEIKVISHGGINLIANWYKGQFVNWIAVRDNGQIMASGKKEEDYKWSLGTIPTK